MDLKWRAIEIYFEFDPGVDAVKDILEYEEGRGLFREDLLYTKLEEIDGISDVDYDCASPFIYLNLECKRNTLRMQNRIAAKIAVHVKKARRSLAKKAK
jgi:hypothetical protein